MFVSSLQSQPHKWSDIKQQKATNFNGGDTETIELHYCLKMIQTINWVRKGIPIYFLASSPIHLIGLFSHRLILLIYTFYSWHTALRADSEQQYDASPDIYSIWQINMLVISTEGVGIKLVFLSSVL